MDIVTIATIIHLFGVALGAGGAFTGDQLFLRFVADKIITEHELKVLRASSIIVWVGLIILLVSGTVLFLQNPTEYLSANKFLVKITIVFLLTINGLLFHAVHLPNLQRHANKQLGNEQINLKNWQIHVVISGVVSVVSWIVVIVLGVLKTIPYTYRQGMGIYLFFVIFASIITVLIKRFYFKG